MARERGRRDRRRWRTGRKQLRPHARARRRARRGRRPRDVPAREAVRRLAVGPDLGRARAVAHASTRAACGSGRRCHVHYQGVDHAIACRGWFIRRFELDDFLLRTSGRRAAPRRARQATSRATATACGRSRAARAATSSAPAARTARSRACSRRRARRGRSACRSSSSRPIAAAVARTPHRPRRRARAAAARRSARLRLERAEDRLAQRRLRHRSTPTEVRAAWQRDARRTSCAAGHVPPTRRRARARARQGPLVLPVRPGAPRRRRARRRRRQGRRVPVGDALGLAQPLTAEGILPAAVSGRVLRRGDPRRRRRRATRRGSPPIRSSPTTGAYYRLRETAAALRPASAPSRRDGGRAPDRARDGRCPRRACAAARSPPASPGCSPARGCRRRGSSIWCSRRRWRRRRSDARPA